MVMALASASAFKRTDWAWPSASKMTARFSRSARICLLMASVMVSGGSIFCNSTLVTLTPQALVDWSKTLRKLSLILSRAVKVSSSWVSPIKLRRLVWARVVAAYSKSSISNSALTGSTTL